MADLLSRGPFLLFPAPSFLSPVPFLRKPVAFFLSPVPFLRKLATNVLSPVPFLRKPVAFFLSPVPFLRKLATNVLSPVPFLLSFATNVLHLSFRIGGRPGLRRPHPRGIHVVRIDPSPKGERGAE